VKKVWLSFLALVALTVASSWLASSLWGGKAARIELPGQVVFTPGETVGAFMARNAIPEKVMAEALGRDQAIPKEAPLASVAPSSGQFEAKLRQAAALASEHATKEWQKILPKFALWAVFLWAASRALAKRRLNLRMRKGYYLAAAALFGVALGSDPSPMGTVKDAVVLLARDGVVFPPRLVAFAVFLGSVLLTNKAICAWGCQFGVLQDLVFRLNRNPGDTAGILRQYKVPFVVSNSVRVAFFALFTAVAFIAGLDLVESMDPFKTFNPAHLGIAGAVAAGLLLAASLFVYRPWCLFFCPFGLAGWLVERFSLNKIRVDAHACIQCGACERACPSTVMGAILHQRKVVPDCFACGTCKDVCPVKAITFGRKPGQAPVRPDPGGRL